MSLRRITLDEGNLLCITDPNVGMHEKKKIYDDLGRLVGSVVFGIFKNYGAGKGFLNDGDVYITNINNVDNSIITFLYTPEIQIGD